MTENIYTRKFTVGEELVIGHRSTPTGMSLCMYPYEYMRCTVTEIPFGGIVVREVDWREIYKNDLLPPPRTRKLALGDYGKYWTIEES